MKHNTSFFTVIIVAVLLFMFSRMSMAAEPVLLKEGQKAPYAGILLDDRLELKARTAILENEQYKEIVADQYEMINTVHQRSALKDEQIMVLKNQLNLNEGITLEKILWFVGGAMIGGVVVKTYDK